MEAPLLGQAQAPFGNIRLRNALQEMLTCQRFCICNLQHYPSQTLQMNLGWERDKKAARFGREGAPLIQAPNGHMTLTYATGHPGRARGLAPIFRFGDWWRKTPL